MPAFLPFLIPVALPLVNNGITALAKKATGAHGWKAVLLNIAVTAASAGAAVVTGMFAPATAVAVGAGSLVASQAMWHAPESVKGPTE